MVYATWLDGEADPVAALWAAQQWAVEAAERAVPYAGRRLRGAVLAVDARGRVMPCAEYVAAADDVRVIGVVAVGVQPDHVCPVCDAVGAVICDVPWRWRLTLHGATARE